MRFAPPEAWVEPEPYDATLAAREGMHLTHLGWARQYDAITGASFHSTAVRLETSLAVQHESQWSLELDARTQTVTLHWLRIVRAGVAVDHLRRERMRVMQRETQLERLVLDGRWTLLAVLDDVRPGDIVEAAYTYETRDVIRPDSREAFFVVPPQALVGRYRFTVFAPAEDAVLQWRAATGSPERRVETLPDGRRRWSWEGAQLALREEEPNPPGNWMDHVWVQVSNLAGWPELAGRVAAAWAEVGAGDTAFLADFARPEKVDTAAILGLVCKLQEDFRYLSLDLQAGGWVPAAPAEVARRRYGDCKDLAWLATTVLRHWGVTARPILVGTGFREQVGALLPMAALFNHAIIEVEGEGRVRWFDLTSSGHGGDYDAHAVGWFGHGLPVDAADNDLRAQPGRRARGVYALREKVLLDTTRGGISSIEMRLRVEGWQADVLRRERFQRGAEFFAKEREQLAQRRYGNRARRSGELHWRDDRPRNVCELVETFDVTDAAYAESHRAVFEIPPSVISQWFALPTENPRRAPWDMPFPCEISHSFTIKMSSPMAGAGRRRSWSEAEFEAGVEEPRQTGAWTRIYRFKTLAPMIAPARVAVYRKQYLEFLAENGGKFQLVWGKPRPRKGPRFGLPEDEDASAAGTESEASGPEASADAAAAPKRLPQLGANAPIDPADAKISSSSSSSSSERREHRRRRRSRRRSSSWTANVPAWVFWVPLLIAFGVLRACLRNM
ncbi:MAG: DUF3857 domain-containing protein [Burkholderiales bacterium]|nr:DUF3857 domain-containing protein [Opitutaceae bacterium]